MDYSSRYNRRPSSRKTADDVHSRYRREMKRREDEQQAAASPAVPGRSLPMRIFLWVFQILLVLLLAYVVVYFFGQMRTNVGQSMDTTLSGGDTVLVNTIAYELSAPRRGDIISFKPNGDMSGRSNIKRIIGLPGETIQIIDGMVYINGQVYLEKKNFPAITNPGIAADKVQLKGNQYFVLGDNRNNSEDSRYADIGLVDVNSIEGKVWCVLKPASHRRLVKS